jgi:membrane-bound metal-dependent hydrolase YbcI (DUF457 family)
VEPITHALTSLAIARAAQKHLPRYGTAMLVISGVAADLDCASYLAGPSSFLRFNRTLLHSLPASAVLAAGVAGAFCFIDRKRRLKDSEPPLRFEPAAVTCAVGCLGHLILDLSSGIGVRLLWPFREGWSAWYLAASLDPWILILLVAGLLLPMLFSLVSEEIGDRKKGARGRGGAIVTLALVAVYLGTRANLHSRAVDLLLSREYHGRVALDAGAFPSVSAPFVWSGVVSTDNTIEEMDISLAPGAEFDPDRSLTRYKPEDSPALEAGQKSPVAKRFLEYARFPLANVIHVEEAYRFEVHDARFPSSDTSPENIFLRVDLASDLKVKRELFLFASNPNP